MYSMYLLLSDIQVARNALKPRNPHTQSTLLLPDFCQHPHKKRVFFGLFSPIIWVLQNCKKKLTDIIGLCRHVRQQ